MSQIHYSPSAISCKYLFARMYKCKPGDDQTVRPIWPQNHRMAVPELQWVHAETQRSQSDRWRS